MAKSSEPDQIEIKSVTMYIFILYADELTKKPTDIHVDHYLILETVNKVMTCAKKFCRDVVLSKSTPCCQ